MGVKDFLVQVFTWWNGATVGTRLYTWRKGVRVGEDDHYEPHPWERPHEENRTGTPQAHFPPGSLYHPQPRDMARPACESWRPDGA